MPRLFCLALLLTLLAPEALAQAPASGEVVVNEIMYDPPSGGASNEWVEIVNRGDRTVDVGGLVLSDAGSSADAIPSPQLLAPEAFLVIVRDEAAFQAAFPGVAYVVAESFPSLNNSGDRVSVSVGGIELDAVDYDPSWGGNDASLERRDPDGPSTEPNFTTSTASGGGTPGAQNTAFETDTTPPEVVSAEAESATVVIARFSEPLDAATALIASNYTISDGIGQPASVAFGSDADVVRLALATPLADLGTYTLTASGVTDRSGNVLTDGSVTFGFGEGDTPEAREIVINEFLYDEPAADNPGEFVELFNRTDKTFDLSDFTLNDAVGDDEPITSTTTILEPGGYAVIVEDAALFQAIFPGMAFVEQSPWSALNNSGDAIVLKYRGATIDSLTYTQTWGGEDASLERIDPRGPSSSASNWATTTDPAGGTPGMENSQFAPDVTGPQPLAVTVGGREDVLTVTFNEPLAPATVTRDAFEVTGGPLVSSVTLEDDGETVTIQLANTFASGGPFVLVARGLADLIGNVTPEASLSFSFTPDDTPPAIVRATAEDATTVLVTFSEELDPASTDIFNYVVSDGIGRPVDAVLDDPTTVRLTLGTPLAGPAIYTLEVDGVLDLLFNELMDGTITFGFGDGETPAPRDLVINEFLYDEPDADNPGEFVELFNRTDQIFDLADFTLNDAAGDDEPITSIQTFVRPGGYAVIVKDAVLFQAVFPGVPFVQQTPWSSLNNTGDAIVLKYQGETIDSLTYAQEWGGEDASLERKDPRGASSTASNWATTSDLRGGTPGAINSQFAPDEAGPQPLAVNVDPTEITLTVTFDEPLAPEAISAAAFSITGGPAVTGATLQADASEVILTLASVLPEGDFTLVASGLTDLLGNTTARGELAFSFAPDDTAPAISRAAADGDRTIELLFSETVVNADNSALYSVSDGIGAPETVQVLDGRTGVRLTLASPLQERTLYTVTASGLRDAAGNVSGASSASVFFGTPDAPLAGDLAITEIMFDPQTGGNGEYVEILNLTADKILDLRDLILDDDEAGDRPIVSTPSILAPGEYLAIVADLEAFRATFPEAPAVEADDFPGLGNSGDLVVLKASGVVLDSVVYDPDWHRVELDDATGISLERRDPRQDANDSNNWSSSLDARGGTPSAPNSIGTTAPPPPEGGGGLSFSESPFDAARGVTIGFSLEAEASLVRIRIFDGAGRLVRELEAGRLSSRAGSKIWDGTDDRGERLRIGPYIVLLEAVDAEGGTAEAYKGTVVLARSL